MVSRKEYIFITILENGNNFEVTSENIFILFRCGY